MTVISVTPIMGGRTIQWRIFCNGHGVLEHKATKQKAVDLAESHNDAEHDGMAIMRTKI